MINVYGWTLRAPSVVTRVVLAVAVSVTLMVADHRGQHVERIRGTLTILLTPLQWLAAVASAVGSSVVEFCTSKHRLEEGNAKLREEHALLQTRLQQFESLEQENARLREVLGSATRVAERALAAELIEVSQEP